MDNINWKQFIIQTLINGLLLYIIQLIINKKFDKEKTRESIKEDNIILLYNKFKDLNILILKLNDYLARRKVNIHEAVDILRDHVTDIIILYDTNSYDYKKINSGYYSWLIKRNIFDDTLSNMYKREIDEDYRIEVINHLDNFRKYTRDFSEEIRKNI